MHDKDDPKIQDLASTCPSVPADFASLAPSRRITVSGVCSGVGKTTVVECLLRAFAPAAALKATTVDSGETRCPIDRTCAVCASLDEPYALIDDRRVLSVHGKDTWRYARAGAEAVMWVQSRREALPAAIEAALARLGSRTIVFEGNTAVPLLDADLRLMVDRAGERRETKPSARALFDSVDAVILNVPRGTARTERVSARARIRDEIPAAEVIELDLVSADSAALGNNLAECWGGRVAVGESNRRTRCSINTHLS